MARDMAMAELKDLKKDHAVPDGTLLLNGQREYHDHWFPRRRFPLRVGELAAGLRRMCGDHHSTGLVDARTRSWSEPLLARLRIEAGLDLEGLLPETIEPGTPVGVVRPEVLDVFGPDGAPTPVIAVGSHDTASAVAAVPAVGPDFAYVSCGTWSLVGLELDAPVLTEASRAANFTNELGVDQTVRYLKNVMGLWVFNEAVRTWRQQGLDLDYAELDAAAGAAEPLRTVVDIDDESFFAPGDMAVRIDGAFSLRRGCFRFV